jgi:starvation-inducible DNA-binding protein
MAKASKSKSKKSAAKPSATKKSGSGKAAGKKSAEAVGKAVAAAPADVMAPMIDIGISGGDRKRIAEGLSHYLADAYSLYLKTHNFHWNVTGPMFNSLHLMFQTQYTEQWNALDEVAERIRALGFVAPGSYEEFARLSSHAEEPKLADHTQWREMVRQLVVGNETLCRTGRKVLGTADKAGDDPTVDLMTRRLEIHEKYAWMLRSLLQ